MFDQRQNLLFVLIASILCCSGGVNGEHEKPKWWDDFKEKYAQKLKQCRFLNGTQPVYFDPCPTLRTGDYSCYFGEQTCASGTPDALEVPDVRCDCLDGIWKCDKYKHCPKNEKEIVGTCPEQHPIYSRYPLKCNATNLTETCQYDYATCPCDLSIQPLSLCKCDPNTGFFKCEYNAVSSKFTNTSKPQSWHIISCYVML